MAVYLFHNNSATLNDLWYESHASILKMVCMELGATDRIEELSEKYLGEKMKMKQPKTHQNLREINQDLCTIVMNIARL